MSSLSSMLRDGRFKIGLFSLNASGGIAMTKVPERWRAGWDEVAAVARAADAAGLDFLLPLQRWRGYGGETDPRGWCMETTTHAAGLAALTSRIAIFTTVQTSIVHPAFAARAVATLDHISGGRAGVNIVCGWNKRDFSMFDAEDVGADRRYDQGSEWTEVFLRLIKGEAPFDHKGEFIAIEGGYCSPSAVSPDGPALMSAAFSPPGRDFAARYCDVLFTTISSIETGSRHVESMKETAAGRDLSVFTPVHMVCRPTREEAVDYYRLYADEMADEGAVENYISENSDSGKKALAVAMRMQRKRIAGGFGSYGIVGSPQDVAAEIIQLHETGFGGISVSFVDFTRELPFFVDNVLPILARAGIR